jgi:hypothetical protein
LSFQSRHCTGSGKRFVIVIVKPVVNIHSSNGVESRQDFHRRQSSSANNAQLIF